MLKLGETGKASDACCEDHTGDLGGDSTRKISPQHRATPDFTAQQLTLTLGVTGENRSSLPGSKQPPRANLLGDASSGSAAAHVSAAREHVPVTNSPIHPLLPFSVQSLLGQQQSYFGWKLPVLASHPKGAPTLFVRHIGQRKLLQTENLIPGTHALQETALFSGVNLIKHSFLLSHLLHWG